MDEIRAKNMASDLMGIKVGNCLIGEYINHGKSAVVLKATHDYGEVACKVFDPEMIELYGLVPQRARIERERLLIGQSHPNLVKIIEGGYCDNQNYLYVVMEYLPQRNICEALSEIPDEAIPTIISQVASAAKYLEDLDLFHRDIKPENVAISDDYQKATLMDLGVIRPLGLSDITDDEKGKEFISTARYSPPELLFRKEEDSLDGWRAVNFYQLGALLHDLIMKEPIFSPFTKPWPRIVEAVINVVPKIEKDGIDVDLINLARAALIKSPKDRIGVLSWDHFLQPTRESESIENMIADIKKKQAIRIQVTTKGLGNPAGNLAQIGVDIRSIRTLLEQSIRNSRQKHEEAIPPISQSHVVIPDGGEINIVLHKSTSHSLLEDHAIKLRYQIHGENRELINVWVVPAPDGNPDSFETAECLINAIYNGPSEAASIEARIEEMLIKTVSSILDLPLNEE